MLEHEKVTHAVLAEKWSEWLKEENLCAYLMSGQDPHLSEYCPQAFATRAPISGFTGSAGFILITAQQAYLWTDGRYFLQAEEELFPFFSLMKLGNDPDVLDFVVSKQAEWKGRIGIDPQTSSMAFWEQWSSAGIELSACRFPYERFWPQRPALVLESVIDYEPYSEFSRFAKLERLRQTLVQGALLVSALDDIAWLLNLRGSDIPYNSLFYAYFFLTAEGLKELYCDHVFSQDLIRQFKEGGIDIFPYEKLSKRLSSWDSVLCFDAQTAARSLFGELPLPLNFVNKSSVIASWKAIKDTREIELTREAHRQDAAAWIRFWYTLERSSLKEWKESTVEDLFEKFRQEQASFSSLSFRPIVGMGSHGAIIHYAMSPQSDASLSEGGVLLLDSGAHYQGATTDVTRTLYQGDQTPSKELCHEYTSVLRSLIALSRARFPRGTTGLQLDVIARSVMWQEGFDFPHGTGHGVGAGLCVHEKPPLISPRVQNPLEKGMVFSIEPGLYRPNSYGIRLENLVLVQESCHTEMGEFLELSVLTLVPFEAKLICWDELSDLDKSWITSYYDLIRREVGPYLLPEEEEFLGDLLLCGK